MSNFSRTQDVKLYLQNKFISETVARAYPCTLKVLLSLLLMEKQVIKEQENSKLYNSHHGKCG